VPIKHLLRLSALWAVICALLAAPMTAVRAQSTCFTGLTATDCQLLADAAPTTAKIKSFVVDYNLSFQATGFAPGNINLTAQGNGPIDFSKAPTTDLVQLLSNVIFSNTIHGSLTIGSQQSSGTLDLRQTNGFLYFRDNPLTKNQWFEFSSDRVLQVVYARSGQKTTLPPSSGGGFDLLPLLAAYNAQHLPDLITANSANGAFIDGQPTTQITLTVNIQAWAKWLLAPENRDLLRRFLSASGQGQSISNQQLDSVRQNIALFDPMFRQTQLSFAWLVGKKDKFYHGFTINFSTHANAAFASLIEGKQDAGPFTINTRFQVTLSRINQPVSVDSVAGATDITEQLIQELSGPLLPGKQNQT